MKSFKPIPWSIALAILFLVFAVRITDRHALKKVHEHQQEKIDDIDQETSRCKRKAAKYKPLPKPKEKSFAQHLKALVTPDPPAHRSESNPPAHKSDPPTHTPTKSKKDSTSVKENAKDKVEAHPQVWCSKNTIGDPTCRRYLRSYCRIAPERKQRCRLYRIKFGQYP